MTQAHGHPKDTVAEEICVLTAISQVSTRMARKLRFLAVASQSEEGGRNHHEQDERYGYDHRRAAQCRPEPTGQECHARTVNETVLENVVVQAINTLLR